VVHRNEKRIRQRRRWTGGRDAIVCWWSVLCRMSWWHKAERWMGTVPKV
jgi:hypothetical protein